MPPEVSEVPIAAWADTVGHATLRLGQLPLGCSPAALGDLMSRPLGTQVLVAVGQLAFEACGAFTLLFGYLSIRLADI